MVDNSTIIEGTVKFRDGKKVGVKLILEVYGKVNKLLFCWRKMVHVLKFLECGTCSFLH